ncbi:D-alanyl-D-alanine carboxypeptidase family protein [Streptomyces sp. NPDC056519]|uniref:D-alanyl-D-alanine carboxypeptidase family protein n=1 Tax=Streptomyces sp. NPDC056519 TaxID=3345849 RepID=UPI003683C10C
MNGTGLGSRLPWPAEGQASVYSEEAGFLGTSGWQDPTPTASIAKVMAAYVILRSHPLANGEAGPMITVDRAAEQEAHSSYESTVPLVEGHSLTQRTLLELVLVPSGSNAARLLARWHSGDESSFVREMNTMAAELGMARTTYADVCGLDPATRSTSEDQLALARAAMDIPVFRSIVARYSTRLPGVGRLCSTNKLLGRPGVIGLKTGTTTAAGGNLIWAAHAGRPGEEALVLGVVMAQRPHTGLAEARTAVRAASIELISSVRRELLPPDRRWRVALFSARERVLHLAGWLGYHGHYYWSRTMARARAATRQARTRSHRHP